MIIWKLSVSQTRDRNRRETSTHAVTPKALCLSTSSETQSQLMISQPSVIAVTGSEWPHWSFAWRLSDRETRLLFSIYTVNDDGSETIYFNIRQWTDANKELGNENIYIWIVKMVFNSKHYVKYYLIINLNTYTKHSCNFKQ